MRNEGRTSWEMNRKRVYMISGESINGSVAVEEERAVVFLNGCEGEYEIYFDGVLLGEALSNARGRIIKKLNFDLNNGGELIIKKDGIREGSARITAEEGALNETESEIESEIEIEKEELSVEKAEEPQEEKEWGFCTDLSSVVKRFKEQLGRLEEAEVLKKGEVNINGEEEENNKEIKVCPDYLWRLPLKDIHFPSNPFLIYSRLKYKHILLKEGDDRFTVGAADVYDEKNVKAAAENGFFCFKTKTEGEVKNGDEGYWLADILKN